MFQVPQNGHIDTKYTKIYHGLDILENSSILHMYCILNLTNSRYPIYEKLRFCSDSLKFPCDRFSHFLLCIFP